MREKESIYGTTVLLPERPADKEIENYGKPRKEQKWNRGELPKMFDNVEYSKLDGKLILTPEQNEYAESELKRCRDGFWIWIGEKARYITGRYYFYLKYNIYNHFEI